jgi:Tfp pilus assembly protein PilO
MFGINKSFIIAGVVLVGVIFMVFWLNERTTALNELLRVQRELQLQARTSPDYPDLIRQYEKRLDLLRNDIKKLSGKFVGQDFETPQLMYSVVKAASSSGMEMTNTAKLDRQAKVIALGGKKMTVQVLSHAITLKGSYTGLVKFLQNLSTWNILHKIESMEVSPAKDSKNEGEIEVALILSVFAVAQTVDTQAAGQKP